MKWARRKSAKAVLAKVKKDLRLKQRGKGMRQKATSVLAQGAVAAPRRAFGTNKKKPNGVRGLIKALDARLPVTLGLPRAVGPYTVVRTTAMIKSSANVIIFSPFKDWNAERWYCWCGVEDVHPTDPINHPNNARPLLMPMHSFGDASEVVPASMTVQCMNPNPINGAEGIFAMGRVNQQLPLGTTPTSWVDFTGKFISYFSPRMLTGGKLALRGVVCHSYPLDMTEYANFAPITQYTFPTLTLGDGVRPGALAPIVFAQNNDQAQTLEFMVTIEWRVRFDPGNAAASSHSFHNTLADSEWNKVIRVMSTAGHGVQELADDATDAGALFGAAALLM